MPELAKDSVALFSYLLPGFLSAWVLYGLTSDPKPSQFERVIQALIFSFAVYALHPFVEAALLGLGSHLGAVRVWDDAASNGAKAAIAVTLGLLLAWYTNTDVIHKWFRRRGFTTRTSYPSEWFGVFSNVVTYVVLQLNDGRRIYGWPKEWPNEPDKGHFYMMQACWIAEDGAQTELSDVHGVLIASKDVKWVEFVGKPLKDSDGT
jgi:predicted membrane protein